MDSLPTEGEIYKGRVAKIESFGAFIEIDGFYANGLVHISQLAKDRVESTEDVVSVGQEVFVKVISVELGEGPRGRPKISLSMKYADQSTGADRDRNGIDMEQEQQRRKSYGNHQQAPVTLEAVYNTICSKCKGKGHLASECFNVGGTTYELIADDDDFGLDDRRSQGRADEARKSSQPHVSVGRGRGATLPSWMTSDGINTQGRRDEERGRKRKRNRSRSRSRSHSEESKHRKKKKDKDHKKKEKKSKHHKSKSKHKDKKNYDDKEKKESLHKSSHRHKHYEKESSRRRSTRSRSHSTESRYSGSSSDRSYRR